jgi:hypothetical protein
MTGGAFVNRISLLTASVLRGKGKALGGAAVGELERQAESAHAQSNNHSQGRRIKSNSKLLRPWCNQQKAMSWRRICAYNKEPGWIYDLRFTIYASHILFEHFWAVSYW